MSLSPQRATGLIGGGDWFPSPGGLENFNGGQTKDLCFSPSLFSPSPSKLLKKRHHQSPPPSLESAL